MEEILLEVWSNIGIEVLFSFERMSLSDMGL